MITATVILSLTVIFIYSSFDEGMIFGKVGLYLEKKLPKWLGMPLFACSVCMAFWYGSLIWFIWFPSLPWLIVPASGGLNYLVFSFLNTLRYPKDCEHE